MGEFKEALKFSAQQRPTITVPPKSASTSAESLFYGASPGAMTLVSNFFSDNFADGGDYRSFSDLLSGGMTSPATAAGGGGLTVMGDELGGCKKRDTGGGAGGGGGSGFKQSRPENLMLPMNVSSVFAVSPGFSPSALLSSPTFFSSSLSSYGMSGQPSLAQVTPQTALSQPHLTIQAEFHPTSSAPSPLFSSMTFQSSTFTPQSNQQTLSNAPQPDKRSQIFPAAVDKPADDGFNWRKYGQKQVKGSEYPRSYYRCTNPSCPVKKKVERSFDGHITEIIYKGQHNHAPSQNGRRGKDGSSSLADLGSEGQLANFLWSGGLGRENDSAQATSIQLHGPSDSEESGENYQNIEDDDDDDDEPNAKRRNAGAGASNFAFTHKTMTEPKIVVQTRSEVDLLDDGYRWRKYGQKVVKGNPNPRSYYKCTTVGCKVRKHVERASTDPRAVITAYEGKHNHDVPAARGSSINLSNNNEASNTRLHSSVAQMNFGTKDQMPISLHLKEEPVVV